MIVEDKEKLLDSANNLSNEILDIIRNKMDESGFSYDPAETSYFMVHILGILTSKICIALEGFADIYGIDGMTNEVFHSWAHDVTKEYLELNKSGVTT